MDDGTAKIYASVTTLIKDGYVDDKTALQEWKQEIKDAWSQSGRGGAV